ncbi:MAG: glycosyltransferase family 39 protein [Candidatus Binataceae bacterium]
MTQGIEGASRALGVLCGIAILAIAARAAAIVLRPAIRDRDRRFAIAMAALAALAIVKLALLPVFPGYVVDMRYVSLWTWVIARLGPAHIYDPIYQCKYAPAYLYALWPAGSLAAAISPGKPGAVLRILSEYPPILTDLVFSAAVYAAIRRIAPPHLALAGALLAALNPALIYTSLVWGQNDSVLAAAILLSTLLVADSRYAIGWAMAALGVLIKAQGLILLPVLAWWMLLESRPRDWIAPAAAALGMAALVTAPFQIGRSWLLLPNLYTESLGWFPRATANAFNLMFLLGGLHSYDSAKVFGISYFALGNLLFPATYLVAGCVIWRNRSLRALLYAVFLVYLGMFVFETRIHERYLYYAVALIAPLVFDSWIALALLGTLTATLLFNLVLVKFVLEHHVFFAANDPAATAAAAINLAAFAIAALWGLAIAAPSGSRFQRLPTVLKRLLAPPGFATASNRAVAAVAGTMKPHGKRKGRRQSRGHR